MGTITQAIAAYGRTKGLEIRTERRSDRASTPPTARPPASRSPTARASEAPIVASNVSAKLTFLKFLPRAALPAEFVRDVESYRTYSTAFKINIACERLPAFTAFDSATCGFAYPDVHPYRPHHRVSRSGPTWTPRAATGRAIPSSPS